MHTQNIVQIQIGLKKKERAHTISLVYIYSKEKPPNLKPVDAKEMIERQQDTHVSVLITTDTCNC